MTYGIWTLSKDDIVFNPVRVSWIVTKYLNNAGMGREGMYSHLGRKVLLF